MMISAVFDANALYSAPLRDFLLRLAEAGLIAPFWSEEIQNEWVRNLLQNRPDLKRENIERTRRMMDSYFSKAVISGYESIIPTLQLPDPNDRHVLAVAIRAKAKYIVSHNITDFPHSALLPHQVEAILPDDFVLQVIEYDAQTFITTVAKHRTFLTRTPKTADEYLATLENQGLLKTVAFLLEHIADI
jgi:predicted nucleic acid-binding protein